MVESCVFLFIPGLQYLCYVYFSSTCLQGDECSGGAVLVMLEKRLLSLFLSHLFSLWGGGYTGMQTKAHSCAKWRGNIGCLLYLISAASRGIMPFFCLRSRTCTAYWCSQDGCFCLRPQDLHIAHSVNACVHASTVLLLDTIDCQERGFLLISYRHAATIELLYDYLLILLFFLCWLFLLLFCSWFQSTFDFSLEFWAGSIMFALKVLELEK